MDRVSRAIAHLNINFIGLFEQRGPPEVPAPGGGAGGRLHDGLQQGPGPRLRQEGHGPEQPRREQALPALRERYQVQESAR